MAKIVRLTKREMDVLYYVLGWGSQSLYRDRLKIPEEIYPRLSMVFSKLFNVIESEDHTAMESSIGKARVFVSRRELSAVHFLFLMHSAKLVEIFKLKQEEALAMSTLYQKISTALSRITK